MIWVRFTNGQCIRYNTATYIIRFAEFSDLYVNKGGKFIAQIPNTCIIEVVHACDVSNPLDKQSDLETAKELRAIKRKLQKVY